MLCHAATSHSFATQINGRMWVCIAAKNNCEYRAKTHWVSLKEYSYPEPEALHIVARYYA